MKVRANNSRRFEVRLKTRLFLLQRRRFHMPEPVPVYSPTTLTEAVGLLAEGYRPLAGGTDAMVRFNEGAWRPRGWVNLLRLKPKLAYIRAEGDWLAVGALNSFTDLLHSPLIQTGAPLVAKAARTVGGPAIRNMGTLGGNLGTASPAGDSLPALYALDALVQIAHASGRRELPIREFILGPGRTALQPGELILGVRFPAQGQTELCTFEKLGLRAAHAISVASVALRIDRTETRSGIRLARVALGALAPTVVRAEEAESLLLGARPVTPEIVAQAVAAARAAARPISDVRGSAEYRRAMAGNLLLRGLARLLGPSVLPAVTGGGAQ